MRCFYLDPGLRGDIGHHANFCRYIAGALRRRGVEVTVFGHAGVAPSLQADCGARPHFRVSTYDTSDGDPISGWLSGFDLFVRMTVEDLARLPPAEAGDLVYVSTVQPAQLMAARLWYQSLPEPRLRLVIEINQTGLGGRREGDSFKLELPDPRIESRPLLFRFIGRRHLHPVPEGLHVISFASATSTAFAELTGCPVTTAPLPYAALGPLRNRAGAAPITIACLGHQRDVKGYFLLPELAALLLQRHAGIEMLIHTVTTGGARADAATAALRDLAAAEPRLILCDQPAEGDQWRDLLDRADLILCPYQQSPYVVTFSALVCEALANAIPVVVPAGTTLEGLLEACGGPGLAFATADVPAIMAATDAVLAQFDRYAERAFRAAAAWPQTQGPDRLAAILIDLAARP